MFNPKLKERPLVDIFLDAIPFRCYKYKDQDIGTIRALSEFDFLLFAESRAVIIEAKKQGNWLTETQEIASIKAEKNNTRYFILIFGDKYIDNVYLTNRKKTLHVEGFDNIICFLKICLFNSQK